jgi:hypothetical protein
LESSWNSGGKLEVLELSFLGRKKLVAVRMRFLSRMSYRLFQLQRMDQKLEIPVSETDRVP